MDEPRVKELLKRLAMNTIIFLKIESVLLQIMQN